MLTKFFNCDKLNGYLERSFDIAKSPWNERLGNFSAQKIKDLLY